MHIMQYILTEVERMDEQTIEDVEQEAIGQVNSWLNENTGEYSGGWSDWAMVGGRYENVPILVYSDENSCEFLEALDLIDNKQISQFNEYFSEFDFPTVNSLMIKFAAGEPVEYPEMAQANLFSLTSAVNILKGHWTWDSAYYDTIDWTPKTKHLRARLLNAIDKNDNAMLYCLVPVDFHF
jgi:hypothetical protein